MGKCEGFSCAENPRAVYRSPPPTRNRIINATNKRFNLERNPVFCALSRTVEKTNPVFRPFYTMRIALACAISALVSTQSSAQPPKPKTPVMVAPPQPLRISLKARREEHVEIPLGIYGTRSQTLEFKIRTQPSAGKLSELKQIGQESAVVTYTPPSDLSISKDQFSYSVRSREGVSAPSLVQILMVDEAPVLDGPALLEFGRLMAGEKTVQTFEISNGGGGLAEGTIEATPPWQLVSPPDYRLRAGAKQSVVVSITPPQGGRIAGELRCVAKEPKTGRVIELRAEAISPVSLRTEQLTLENLPESPLRSGVVEIANNTDSPQILSISASPRLTLPQSATLAPQAKSRIHVELAANDFAALEDEIRIQSATETLRVSVKAAAISAILQIDRQEIHFQPVQVTTAAHEKLTLENKGGSLAPVSVTVEAPFSAAVSGAILQPGERKELALIFSSSAEGKFNGVLKITSLSREITIPLSAEAIGSSTSSRKARSAIERRDTPPSRNGSPPAAIDRDDAGPTPQDSAILAPPRPEILDLTPTSVVLRWNHRGTERPSSHRIETRQLSLKNEELQVSWSPLAGSQVEHRGDHVEAKLTGLTPATTHSLRFTPLDQTGRELDLPRAIEFITPKPPEEKRWITLPKTMTALLCLCLIGIARKKWTGNPF